MIEAHLTSHLAFLNSGHIPVQFDLLGAPSKTGVSLLALNYHIVRYTHIPARALVQDNW